MVTSAKNPEIVDLLSEITEAYPIKDPKRGKEDKYLIDNWKYMSSVTKDTLWL